MTILSHIRKERLIIEVVDQGRGIAPADQELIFQKFRQTTGPDRPLVKGTGLGLSIAKAIIEEHGGYIGVRSTPSEGSVFYFILPQWRTHNVELKDKTEIEKNTQFTHSSMSPAKTSPEKEVPSMRKEGSITKPKGNYSEVS